MSDETMGDAPAKTPLRTDAPIVWEVPYLRGGTTLTVTLKSLDQMEEDGDMDVLFDLRTEGAGQLAKSTAHKARDEFAKRVMTDIGGLEPAPDTSIEGWQTRVPKPVRIAIGMQFEMVGLPAEPRGLTSAEKNV